MNNNFFIKEKKDKSLTIRVSTPLLNKLKTISNIYNFSQAEVIEVLVKDAWEKISRSQADKINDKELLKEN